MSPNPTPVDVMILQYMDIGMLSYLLLISLVPAEIWRRVDGVKLSPERGGEVEEERERGLDNDYQGL